MGKVVYHDKEYLVVKERNGHVIINSDGQYENHGHVKNLKTAKLLIKLIRKGIVPHSKYLRSTVLRISIDQEYIEKINCKIEKDSQRQYYINSQKGVRKC